MGRFGMFIVKCLYYLTRPLNTSPTRDSANTDPHSDRMNLTTVGPACTVLVSGAQPRVVLQISSPTGTSRLPWKSIAHWSIVIGNPGSENDVLQSDLVRNRDSDEVTHKTSRVSLSYANAKHAVVLGYTRMTDEEIGREADAWIESNPIFNLRSNNCQDFVMGLAKAIIDPAFGVDPNPDVQYRFREDLVKLVGTVQHSGSMPGWIMPTSDKILVNVKQTRDADTWMGQVNGTDDIGKFYKLSVERASPRFSST